ncbi:12773_t:CDS:2 [Funneliformis geosporum]|nr:12773_t:CDS:2 [Funneliformis geosporum]
MTNKSKCKRRQNKNKKRSNKDSNVEEKELTAVEKSEEELSNSHASNSTTVTFQLSPVVANMIQKNLMRSIAMANLKRFIAAEKYLINNRQPKNKVISQQKLNKSGDSRTNGVKFSLRHGRIMQIIIAKNVGHFGKVEGSELVLENILSMLIIQI